jgi:hypothetical protein
MSLMFVHCIRLVEELNLQDIVSFHPPCPSECLAELVSALHCPCEFDSHWLWGQSGLGGYGVWATVHGGQRGLSRDDGTVGRFIAF